MLFALIGLTGCTKKVNVVSTEDGTTTQTSVKTDSDGSSVSIKSDDGDSTVNVAFGLPDGWPSDLPILDNAEVAYGAIERDDEKGITTYSTNLALPVGTDGQQAMNQLTTLYEQAGWSLHDQVTVNVGLTSISFEGSKSGQEVTVVYIDGPNTDESLVGSITITGEYEI